MPTIITRETGASSKGAPLTNAELDQNFINLNTAIASVEKISIATNTTAVNGGRYSFTGACTLTLPSGSQTGWKIYVENATDLTSGCIIARNGANIDSVAEDMTIDIARCSFQLVCSSPGEWKIYEST